MEHDSERVVHIGELERRGETVRFGIKEKDRSRHMYVIGQTGTGKSTLLEALAVQDIQNGEGLIFMDPHGQSVENLLNFIPPERLEDSIYLAPHLQDSPVGLNIMEDIGYDKRHLVVSSLIASFHKIWGEGTWSDRMEYILSNTLFALLEYPDTTLLDVGRMYNNKTFRNAVIANIKDPQVRKYWVEDYANYNERYIQDATPAIQNKLGQFTANPLIRNIIGQKKSAFDFREVLDTKKILLVNLSKGQIGENNAKMLGVLFTTKIYLSALSRSEMSRQELDAAPPCNFYVDEFQSFANSSFADILSEARKYKLNLILAHQYIGQLYSDEGSGNMIRDAVFGNVGTFISFRVGPVDAEIIAKQFAPDITEEDLVSLPRFHIFLTLNIDNSASPPFSARTIGTPEPLPVSLVDKIIQQTGQRYGVARSEIEEQIKNRLEEGSSNDVPDKNAQGDSKQKPKKPSEKTQKPFGKIVAGLLQQATRPSSRPKEYSPLRDEKPPAPSDKRQGSKDTSPPPRSTQNRQQRTDQKQHQGGGSIKSTDTPKHHTDQKQHQGGGATDTLPSSRGTQNRQQRTDQKQHQGATIKGTDTPKHHTDQKQHQGDAATKSTNTTAVVKKDEVSSTLPSPNTHTPERKESTVRASEVKPSEPKRTEENKDSTSTTPPDVMKDTTQKSEGTTPAPHKVRHAIAQSEKTSPDKKEQKKETVPHVSDSHTQKGTLADIIQSTRSSGLKKDLAVQPKKKKQAPPVDYENGWVPIKDMTALVNTPKEKSDS